MKKNVGSLLALYPTPATVIGTRKMPGDFTTCTAKVVMARKKHFESNEKHAGLIHRIYSTNASGLL